MILPNELERVIGPGDLYGASDPQPGRAVYTPFEVVSHGLEPTCG